MTSKQHDARGVKKTKAAQKVAGDRASTKPANVSLAIPTITEIEHFGDHTKPEQWFIDAETAINLQPNMSYEADDLGYYDDGVKRTLTDEQIAMFRHSEVQELLKECRLQREELEYQTAVSGAEVEVVKEKRNVSPVSQASSLEDELIDVSLLHSLRPTTSKRQISPSSRSDTSKSTNASAKRRRQEEIPYSQRKKRNWEQYIRGEDEAHGSMTQRRIIREMDELHAEDVVMDYGDEEPAKSDTNQGAAADVRKAPVSYEDM